MTFTCPIYFTRGKRKPKTSLCGMNQHNSMHFHERNAMKAYLEAALKPQLSSLGPIIGPYTVHYSLYYKNSSCDGSNIVALVEKSFLDILQKSSLTREDNVKHHLGSTWSVAGQDKINPRMEITIKESHETHSIS